MQPAKISQLHTKRGKKPKQVQMNPAISNPREK